MTTGIKFVKCQIVVALLLLLINVNRCQRKIQNKQRVQQKAQNQAYNFDKVTGKYYPPGKTYFLRTNSFSNLSFQEFASRYTGMGVLAGR